jgi:TetR/AcrR family transcriptional regulator, transcriptional repressor of bet genes
LIEDTIGQLYFLSIQKFVNAYKKFNGYSKTMIKQAKKNKRRIEDIRRVELIEAAYRIFMQSGLKGLTTTRICNEAGMSQGILTYYFKDKDEVLFEMVRLANRILMNDVVSRLKLATTGWERVVAVIEGNFPPQRFDRNTANAWISFYADAAHNERYARLQHLFYRRLRSNLTPVLNPILSGKRSTGSCWAFPPCWMGCG